MSKDTPSKNPSGMEVSKYFPMTVTVKDALAPRKRKPKVAASAEITVQQFLDFLKTAYQVQDNLEGVQMGEGMTEVIDWIKLKESELVKPREASCQTSDSKLKDSNGKSSTEFSSRNSDASTSNPDESGDHVKNKLSEIIGEGLLDSVLPYLVPASAPTSQINLKRVPPMKLAEKPSGSLSGGSSKETLVRKSIETPPNTALLVRNDSEVEIHVCDEIKNTKKDFKCNQTLLVQKMGYFADVTTGQRLEDMDISVHCDVGIFEWLMRWVKKDSLLEHDWPALDAQCVVPVLVSAAFLKMDPLLEECLSYCHEHMNDVLRTSTNLSCINDSVLTRLAAKYTSAEVECIRDRKDKIQSRLFYKLIRSLIEPVPESLRGHWMSLAKVFRCAQCKQLVSPSVGAQIPCVACNMLLQSDGTVVNHHVRDPHWDVKDYCLKLLKVFKTWRKVYWRLWGDAHFLFCVICRKFFPAHQIGWCRYHPDPPQFFSVDAQRAPLPVGRYPCCGERAYRFQLIDNHSGCKFREHHSCTKDVKDGSVLAVLETYRHLIEVAPPELMFPERLTRLVARDTSGANDGRLECKEVFWWDGLQLLAPRPKLGLLGAFLEKEQQQRQTPAPAVEEPSSDDDTGSSSSSSRSTTASSSTSSAVTEESPPPSPKAVATKKCAGKKKRKKKGRLWQHDLSVRSNQDLQRAFEESSMKKMVSVLCRRVSASSDCNAARMHKGLARHVTPTGGVWVRLENEWKENNTFPLPQKMRNIYTGKPRVKATRLV